VISRPQVNPQDAPPRAMNRTLFYGWFAASPFSKRRFNQGGVTHQKVIVNNPILIIAVLLIIKRQHLSCGAPMSLPQPRGCRAPSDLSNSSASGFAINGRSLFSTDSIKFAAAPPISCNLFSRSRARDFFSLLCRVRRTRTSHASGSRLLRDDLPIFSLPLASLGPRKTIGTRPCPSDK